MTNKKLLEKLKEDMEMRGFSHWTKERYYSIAKETVNVKIKLIEKFKIKLIEFYQFFLMQKT